MTNRLAHESSPYLRQHAGNPVDWYPWGEQALLRARAQDKPIFLSIGYSACHWCHVMAHESFENEQVARLLNTHFVSIKVDREERPDLDQIYMAAVQALTGGGGWPMSVFLTPEGHPFYGGTYWPPVPRHGMPSFIQVLNAVADAWQNRRQELISGAMLLVSAIKQQTTAQSGRNTPDLHPDTLAQAFESLRESFDHTNGGWGDAPKFPQPMALEFLLRFHHATRDAAALQMATQTLEAMARGGMYDQLGGGFHRYSVDAHWTVPHFEKMLYDNAQLARVYLHAWQITGEQFFRTITEETLDYVVREMTDPGGGFYSTQDADSEGEEGKFFVWTPEEIRGLLGPGADAFSAAYGFTAQGDFERGTVLEYVGEVARRPALAVARRRLWEARGRRVHPGRDDKILTSWNGLAVAAFAEAARSLGRSDYQEVAERSAGFLLRELWRADGRLLHTWQAGTAKQNGFLEDYACLMDGLLELYQATFDPRWVLPAHALAETMLTHFSSPDGGLYDTSDDHEALIIRPRDLQDNATPSGNAMSATVLLKVAALSPEPRYVDCARQALVSMQSLMAEHPLGFGQWLQALSFALSEPHEIAIVGYPGSQDTQALLTVTRDGYRPFQVVALGAPHPEGSAVPLLRHRRLVDGRAAAYVCTRHACQAPVTEPAALQALLRRPPQGIP